jgi:uncharacterized protein YdeI (YjbR/CyaY-like superfamily)
MLDYIRKAAEIAASGHQTSPMAARRKSRPELPLHPEFAAALERNKKAAATLHGFPPGRRREYLEWINDAKQDKTRATRIATAITWVWPKANPATGNTNPGSWVLECPGGMLLRSRSLPAA